MDAAASAHARGETRDQVLDRNVNELLQEIRVVLTGVQILFAFLLTLAWVVALFGGDLLRRARLGRSRALEFGIATAIAFAIFYVGIERAVAAILLGAS